MLLPKSVTVDNQLQLCTADYYRAWNTTHSMTTIVASDVGGQELYRLTVDGS